MIFWCFFGFARPLLLLVLILPEVHDPADRRHRGRRDLDEVETLLLGYRQGLRRRHDAELLPGVVDDADFADADAFVHPNAVVTPWASVESDNGLLGITDSAPRSAIVDVGGRQRFDPLLWPRACASSSAAAMNASIGLAPWSPPAPRPHGDRALRDFAIARHQHVRDLLQLGLSNLISRSSPAGRPARPEARRPRGARGPTPA